MYNNQPIVNSPRHYGMRSSKCHSNAIRPLLPYGPGTISCMLCYPLCYTPSIGYVILNIMKTEGSLATLNIVGQITSFHSGTII